MIVLKTLLMFTIVACSVKLIATDQSNCPDKQVKGYYIKRVNKSDFEEIARNKKLKKEGKSYEIVIDYSEQIFFIPSDSIKGAQLSDLLKRDSTFFGESFVYLPSNQTKEYVGKYCSNERNMELMPESLEPNFFVLKEESPYLYNITYIEAQSIHAQVVNNRLNKIHLKIIYRIPESQRFINCYFIHSINKVNEIITDEGLLEWGQS